MTEITIFAGCQTEAWIGSDGLFDKSWETKEEK